MFLCDSLNQFACRCLILFYLFFYVINVVVSFLQENQKLLVNTLEQTKEMYVKNLLERDAKLKEINNIKEQMSQQIEEIQVTADSLQSSLKSEKKR